MKSAQQRKNFAEKRGGGCVSGESVFANLQGNNAGFANFLGTEPTPELVAEMGEQYAERLRVLNDVTLTAIVELKFQSYSNEEIAERIGKNVRTVERKLSLVREIWGASSPS